MKSKRIFVKGRDREEIMFVCLINSCRLPSESQVAAIPDIPLPWGEGKEPPYTENWGGGGGQGRGVGLAVHYKFAILPGPCIPILTCRELFSRAKGYPG